MPDGAVRSPDAVWIRRERWQALEEKERQRFAPISPDFVIELKSPGDSIQTLQEKMAGYMENGVRLGFLIDPAKQVTYIYGQGAAPGKMEGFDRSRSGEDVLPGFGLDLRELE